MIDHMSEVFHQVWRSAAQGGWGDPTMQNRLQGDLENILARTEPLPQDLRTARSRAKLGLKAETSLLEAIRRTYDWFATQPSQRTFEHARGTRE